MKSACSLFSSGFGVDSTAGLAVTALETKSLPIRRELLVNRLTTDFDSVLESQDHHPLPTPPSDARHSEEAPEHRNFPRGEVCHFKL